MDEAAFVRWRCDEAVDGSAVGGGRGGNGKGRAVGEGDVGEADNGCVEGGEIGAKPRADAAGVIGAERSYSAIHSCLCREDEGFTGVDRIDELSADGLADTHGEMVFNLDWKWGSCG